MTTQVSEKIVWPEVSKEQAEFNARFEALKRDYYETVRKTNLYSSAVQAQGENYAAWLKLSEFAKKYPQYRRILPINPTTPSIKDCPVS
jgi:hypothetical protein